MKPPTIRTTLVFDELAVRKTGMIASSQGLSASEYIRRAITRAIAQDLPQALAVLDAPDEA